MEKKMEMSAALQTSSPSSHYLLN